MNYSPALGMGVVIASPITSKTFSVIMPGDVSKIALDPISRQLAGR
jgi:hypothetical protein